MTQIKQYKIILLYLVLIFNFQSSTQQVQEKQDLKLPDKYPYINTIPVKGGVKYGYYFIDLYIGTPGQKQSLILDTGSHLSTITCSSCGDKCGEHLDQPFDKEKSESFQEYKCDIKNNLFEYQCPKQKCNKDKQCEYQINYVENSEQKGILVQDYIQFQQNNNDSDNNYEKFMGIFGCNSKETNLIYDQNADGILGLGVPSDTKQKLPNIIDLHYKQLLEKNNGKEIELQAVSFCFGIEDGYMQLGQEINQEQNNKIVLKYNDKTSLQQYVIQQKLQVVIDGVKANDPYNKYKKQQVFIDSGATTSYFHYNLYQQFMVHFQQFCSKSEDLCPGKVVQKSNCFYYDKEAMDGEYGRFFEKFPSISLQFYDEKDDSKNNVQEYQWPAKYYMYETKKNLFCVGIQSYAKTMKRKQIVLGQSFFKQNLVTINKKEKSIEVIQGQKCSEDVWGQPEILFDYNYYLTESRLSPVLIIFGIVLVFYFLYRVKKYRSQKLEQEDQDQSPRRVYNQNREEEKKMSRQSSSNNQKSKNSDGSKNNNNNQYVDVNQMFDQDEELDQFDDDQYMDKDGIYLEDNGDSDQEDEQYDNNDSNNVDQEIQLQKVNRGKLKKKDDFYQYSYEDTFA